VNAASILARLRELGITAEARGTGLALRPASVVPDGLMGEVKAHKAELLALLAANERDGWGLTAAERAGASARLNAETETSTTPELALPSLRTARALPLAPDTAKEASAARPERATAGALDGCEAPAPMPPLLEPGAPGGVRFDAPQAAMVDGLLRAARQRPPSWADPAALPSRGCICSCCKGQRWWCEREVPKGWRCWTCHPPVHLPRNAVAEIAT